MTTYIQTPAEAEKEKLKKFLITEFFHLYQSSHDRQITYHETILLAPLCIKVSTLTSLRMPPEVLAIYKKYLHNHTGHAYTLLFQKARKRWSTTTPIKKEFSFTEIFETAVSEIAVHILKK